MPSTLAIIQSRGMDLPQGPGKSATALTSTPAKPSDPAPITSSTVRRINARLAAHANGSVHTSSTSRSSPQAAKNLSVQAAQKSTAAKRSSSSQKPIVTAPTPLPALGTAAAQRLPLRPATAPNVAAQVKPSPKVNPAPFQGKRFPAAAGSRARPLASGVTAQSASQRASAGGAPATTRDVRAPAKIAKSFGQAPLPPVYLPDPTPSHVAAVAATANIGKKALEPTKALGPAQVRPIAAPIRAHSYAKNRADMPSAPEEEEAEAPAAAPAPLKKKKYAPDALIPTSHFTDAAAQAAGDAIAGVGRTAANATDAFGRTAGVATRAVGDTLGAVGGLTGAPGGGKGGLGNVTGAVGNAVGGTGRLAGDTVGAVGDTAGQLVGGLGNTLGRTTEGLLPGQLGGTVGNTLTGATNGLQTTLENTTRGVGKTLNDTTGELGRGNLLGGVGGLTSGLGGTVSGIGKGLGDTVGGTLGGVPLVGGVGKGLGNAVTGITGGLGDGVGKIGEGDLLGGVGSVLGGVTQGVGGLLGGVLGGLGGGLGGQDGQRR